MYESQDLPLLRFVRRLWPAHERRRAAALCCEQRASNCGAHNLYLSLPVLDICAPRRPCCGATAISPHKHQSSTHVWVLVKPSTAQHGGSALPHTREKDKVGVADVPNKCGKCPRIEVLGPSRSSSSIWAQRGGRKSTTSPILSWGSICCCALSARDRPCVATACTGESKFTYNLLGSAAPSYSLSHLLGNGCGLESAPQSFSSKPFAQKEDSVSRERAAPARQRFDCGVNLATERKIRETMSRSVTVDVCAPMYGKSIRD